MTIPERISLEKYFYFLQCLRSFTSYFFLVWHLKFIIMLYFCHLPDHIKERKILLPGAEAGEKEMSWGPRQPALHSLPVLLCMCCTPAHPLASAAQLPKEYYNQTMLRHLTVLWQYSGFQINIMCFIIMVPFSSETAWQQYLLSRLNVLQYFVSFILMDPKKSNIIISIPTI